MPPPSTPASQRSTGGVDVVTIRWRLLQPPDEQSTATDSILELQHARLSGERRLLLSGAEVAVFAQPRAAMGIQTANRVTSEPLPKSALVVSID